MLDEFGMPIETSMGSTGDISGADASFTDFPPDSGAGPGDVGGMMPVQFMGGIPGIIGRGAISGGRAMASIGRRAGNFLLANGAKLSTTKAWAIAKRYGPEVAAAVVGMSVGDFLAVMAHSGAITSSVHHRRSGISSRDIRTTRRVVNFVSRMQHQIGCVHSPRAHLPRHHRR
jgi:hypothetical protein